MTDREPLLATIAANSDDDGPRLVYADWLEDQGEGDRAEFIRVQVELAEIQRDVAARGPSVGPSAAKINGLAERERELLSNPRNFCNWVPLFLHQGSGVGIRCVEPPTVEITGGACKSVTFSRGFPAVARFATLNAVIGGPCQRCGGDGQAHGSDRPFEWSADVDYGKCVVCRGTGRTPALGPALLAACPTIQAVGAKDKRPLVTGDNWHLMRNVNYFAPSYLPSNNVNDLPGEICDLLPPSDTVYGDSLSGPNIWVYSSEPAALDALSTALAAWCRERANPTKEVTV